MQGKGRGSQSVTMAASGTLQMTAIRATPASTPAGLAAEVKPGNDRGASHALADDGESEDDADDSGMSDVVSPA
jgi:hypothetical protein